MYYVIFKFQAQRLEFIKEKKVDVVDNVYLTFFLKLFFLGRKRVSLLFLYKFSPQQNCGLRQVGVLALTNNKGAGG